MATTFASRWYLFDDDKPPMLIGNWDQLIIYYLDTMGLIEGVFDISCIEKSDNDSVGDGVASHGRSDVLLNHGSVSRRQAAQHPPLSSITEGSNTEDQSEVRCTKFRSGRLVKPPGTTDGAKIKSVVLVRPKKCGGCFTMKTREEIQECHGNAINKDGTTCIPDSVFDILAAHHVDISRDDVLKGIPPIDESGFRNMQAAKQFLTSLGFKCMKLPYHDNKLGVLRHKEGHLLLETRYWLNGQDRMVLPHQSKFIMEFSMQNLDFLLTMIRIVTPCKLTSTILPPRTARRRCSRLNGQVPSEPKSCQPILSASTEINFRQTLPSILKSEKSVEGNSVNIERRTRKKSWQPWFRVFPLMPTLRRRCYRAFYRMAAPASAKKATGPTLGTTSAPTSTVNPGLTPQPQTPPPAPS